MKLFVSSFIVLLLCINVQAKVWNVNVDCLSDTITNSDSENIDVAFAYSNSGDIISIASGTYVYSIQNTVDTTANYFLYLLSDNVYIYGSGYVCIDGEDTSIILNSAGADSVIIKNITFTGGYNETISQTSNSYPSALDLYSADSWVIENNIFYNNNQSDSLGLETSQAKGSIIILGRWSTVKDNVFDSNSFYVDGVCDTINGLIYLDYGDTFVGNTFKNNLIWNISDNQKVMAGLVYYNRAYMKSYWYDNVFEGNRALNYNALSGAVAFIYQDNYNNIVDSVYGDSNIEYNNYYFDNYTHNISDTDILYTLSFAKTNSLVLELFNNYPSSYVKANVVGVDIFDNYPSSYVKANVVGVDIFDNVRYSHNKVISASIDLYNLLPYYPPMMMYYRNYLLHTKYRRRFK